jgi:mannose-6-phosphate isomerase-like protein (cupin superfamily)
MPSVQGAAKGAASSGVKSRPIEEEWRPWGSFHTLEEGPGYKVKRLVVLPGQRLSLQRHRHRAEHWVVVAGTATVTNGTRVLRLGRRACAVITRQAWHRIENRGRTPVVVIEVQHGAYLGEDDIIRKQDDYGRVANGGPRATSRRTRTGGTRG